MLLKWHGHACFEIQNNGESLAFDPHDGDYIGIARPMLRANVILVSHEHRDHNAVEYASSPGAKIVRGAKDLLSGPFSIHSFPSYHDDEGGAKRGMNTIFKVETEGMTLVHMGDVGAMPCAETLREIKSPDLLMLPVGGTFTIGPRQAGEVVETLNPKIAVPMHYRLEGLKFKLSPVESFLSEMGGRKIVKVGNFAEISLSNLPIEQSVWVFSI